MASDCLLQPHGTEALSADDVQRLTLWNSNCPEPVDRCVDELISYQCALHPRRHAVDAWDGAFTYEELEDLSDRLASQLATAGISPGDFVPICSEKSCWVVIALVGVMKVGAAFLLLDINHPRDRLLEMCQDVSATLVLTSPSCMALAETLQVPITMAIENGTEMGSRCRRATAREPRAAMYAVFTSGSTGRPKGAVNSHAAFATMADKTIELCGITPDSRALQFSSYAFDASFLDLFLPLLRGGCVCIPSEAESKNDLMAFINRMRVNWACLTPSVARILSPQHVPGLRCLALAGEAVRSADIQRWAPFARVIGIYGASECAVVSTTHPDLRNSASPAILGCPVAGVCWVVDPADYRRLLPVGAEGELLLEGPGVGDGYLNRPEQTASAFVEPPPWLGRPPRGALYRTGDLVRYNPDGSLEYVDRKDTQVKLRGQRIELGEVEHQVRQCLTDVARDAVAEVVQPPGRAPCLCVFLCLSDEASGLVCDPPNGFFDLVSMLTARLRRRLPRYMIPDHFVPIGYVPLNGNGKTDRRRLREVASARPWETTPGPHPDVSGALTVAEARLRDLWVPLLGIDAAEIGPDSHWLAVGGNSLLAMQLVGDAAATGFVFTYQEVFENPTLRDLAQVARLQDVRPTVGTETIEPYLVVKQATIDAVRRQYQDPDAITNIYPCTTDQRDAIAASLANQVSFTAHLRVELSSDVDAGRLARAWEAVTDATDILRTHIVQLAPGQYVQAVARRGAPPQQVTRLPEHDLDIWALKTPLARLLLQGRTAVLLIHHAIYDGFSLGRLFQEWERAYHGERLCVAPFNRFIRWTSDVDGSVAAFWSQRFHGYDAQRAPFPPLPEPGYVPSGSSVTQRDLPLPGPILHTITVDSCLRLALAVAMYGVTQIPDVVFGVHVSRRGVPVAGIADIVGPTTASFPVRIQLDVGQSLRSHVEAIQHDTMDTLPYQCAEREFLQAISPEVAAACRYQTSLLVQPDWDSLFPAMFARRSSHEQPFERWSLCFVAEPSGCHLRLYAFFDERMIQSPDVDFMLERMGRVLEELDRRPATLAGEILAEK